MTYTLFFDTTKTVERHKSAFYNSHLYKINF
nr:MAG TPA: hypothetical protein [Microviridae sp.]